jgi:hypothetical protein
MCCYYSQVRTKTISAEHVGMTPFWIGLLPHSASNLLPIESVLLLLAYVIRNQHCLAAAAEQYRAS